LSDDASRDHAKQRKSNIHHVIARSFATFATAKVAATKQSMFSKNQNRKTVALRATSWIPAFAGMTAVLTFLDNECGSVLRVKRRSDYPQA
jgi:hypothetical protein